MKMDWVIDTRTNLDKYFEPLILIILAVCFSIYAFGSSYLHNSQNLEHEDLYRELDCENQKEAGYDVKYNQLEEAYREINQNNEDELRGQELKGYLEQMRDDIYYASKEDGQDCF